MTGISGLVPECILFPEPDDDEHRPPRSLTVPANSLSSLPIDVAEYDDFGNTERPQRLQQL